MLVCIKYMVFTKGGRKIFEGGKGQGQYQTEEVMVDQKIRRKYDLRMVFELEILKNLKNQDILITGGMNLFFFYF